MSVPAVRGKTDAAVVEASGAAVVSTVDDWIIAASDLVSAGVRFQPEPGNRITGDGRTYEVSGSPAWRYSDPHGIR